MTNTGAHRIEAGDKIRFIANGVTGVVLRNLGPAVNTRTGLDVIEWLDVPMGVVCLHDMSRLEFIGR